MCSDQSCLCAPNASWLSLCILQHQHLSYYEACFRHILTIQKSQRFSVERKILVAWFKYTLAVQRDTFYGYVTVVCLSHIIFGRAFNLNKETKIMNLAVFHLPRLSAHTHL